MNIRFIFPFLAATMLSGILAAQSPASYSSYASQADKVSAGRKLAPRSEVTPYPTRQEAISRTAESSYKVNLLDWETTAEADGIRFTTRFKKHFSWDNRSVILRLNDVTSSFQIMVNDSLAGFSQAGMGRTEFDITKLTTPDYNTISIKIFPDAVVSRIEQGREKASPTIGSASVISQPTVRINDVFTKSSFEGNTAFVKIDVVTESILLNPKEYIVSYELIDPSGKTVSTLKRELHTLKHSRDTTSFIAKVDNPHKWNHETPNLYTLLITTRNDNRVAENIAFLIGLRNIGYKSNVITVDGTPVHLNAARYSTNAAPEITESDLKQLKNQGYNTIITDLRPQPEYFYAKCNELGFYVCSEADIDTGKAAVSKMPQDNSGNSLTWLSAYVERAAAAYYSTHIHPCVIMYSPAKNSSNGYCMYEAYNAIKKADPSALVLNFIADGQWNTDLTPSVLNSEPDGKATQQDKLSVSLNDNCDTVIIGNRLHLSRLDGTYKITVKKGRKNVAFYTDSFSIDRENKIEIAIPDALPFKGVGSVEVELQAFKQGVNQEKALEISSGKDIETKIGGILGEKLSDKLGVDKTTVIKVGDVYDIITVTLPL